MSFKVAALDKALKLVRFGLKLLGKRNEAFASAHIVEQLAPVVTVDTPLGPLKFHCPGDLLVFRAHSLLEKEPETIEWIDSFREGDVFWDVGANVGVYSLYAALGPGARVLAFEPATVNCHLLNRNIEINDLDQKITAFCTGFSDTSGLERLYMGNTQAGGSMHSLSEEVDTVQGKPFRAQFRQGTIGFSIDDFVARYQPAFPNHLKIDVDGIEDRIIAGASRTIADGRLRSLLVEMDTAEPDYCERVKGMLEDAGMRLLHKKHAAMFDEPQYATSVYNYVFVRDR